MANKKVTLLVDRAQQNAKGELIVHLKAYFNQLIRRVGYIKAKLIMRREYHIFVNIK